MPGRGDAVGSGKNTDSNARDAADKVFDEPPVYVPVSCKTDVKDRGPGRVAGILRNPIRNQPSPDYGAEHHVLEQNVRHSSLPRQEPSDDGNGTESEGKKPLSVHKLGEDGVPGSSTAPRIQRINRSLVAKSVVTFSSQHPSRRELINESYSHNEKTKSTVPGTAKTVLNAPRASDRGSQARVHTPPPPEFLQQEPHRTQLTPSSDRGSQVRVQTPPPPEFLRHQPHRTQQAHASDRGSQGKAHTPQPRDFLLDEPHRSQQGVALHPESQLPPGRSLPPSDSLHSRNPAPGNEHDFDGHERFREPTRAGAERGFAQRESGDVRTSVGYRHRERSPREYAVARQYHPQDDRRDWSHSHHHRSFSDADRSWNDANRMRSSERYRDERAGSSTDWSSEGDFQRRNGNPAQARNASRALGFERGNDNRAPGRSSYKY